MKKYYFINRFDTKLINLQDKKTVIIYRNYDLKKVNKNEILKIKNTCRTNGNKFLISNNIKLAIQLNLDGVYIPSFNKNTKHLAYTLKRNFLIIGSAHNRKEILQKETQGLSEIFISSIFKKNKNFLGKYKFKLLKKLTNKPVVALGGISRKNEKELKLINCLKFAGISYFE